MTTKAKRTLLLALLTVTASTALAQNSKGQNNDDQGQNSQGGCIRTACVRAPEINPAQAMGALTLLAGAVAVVRGFRRKPK